VDDIQERENETKEVIHNAILMSGVAIFFALPWFFLNS